MHVLLCQLSDNVAEILLIQFLRIILTIYLEILAVIKFGNLPEIWPNALLVEFKFGSLPEQVLIDEY